MGGELQRIFQVLVFRDHGNLVDVNTNDFTLQVDQLALTHLDDISRREVVSYLPCTFARYSWLLVKDLP